MENIPNIFREKLASQAEVCARKTLEWLQKDLQSIHMLEPADIFYLAQAAEIFLSLRDMYGEE